MAFNSITLQGNDGSIEAGDILGRLNWAAPNESDGSVSIEIAASIIAEAEETFNATNNSTSLVFHTASDDTADAKLKITSSGHFIPITDESYDLGSDNYYFRNAYVSTYYGDHDGPIISECRNDTGSTISAGTPVYVSGYYSANGKPQIAPADASNSSKMPAVGIMANSLATATEGHFHAFGLITQINTASFSVGDTVYVASGGGLTNSRPTGATILIQNIGRVLRSDSTQGRILILGPGRTNDVPNSITVNNAFTFPTTDGTTGQVITTNGAGTLSWSDMSGGGGGLDNIVEDTTPQLGGNLDLQTYDITSVGTTGGDLKIGINPIGFFLPIDYHTLITDNANTRVGIGIDSPSYPLDIGTNGSTTDSSMRVQKIVPLNTVVIGTAHSTSSTTPMGAHYGSVLFGNGAGPTTSKCLSYATNYFSAAGDAQKVSTVVQYETTDATTKYLNAAKTGGYLYSTYVRNDTFLLPPDSSATFTIHLIANNDTDGTSAGWIFRGCVKSVNKSLSFVGSPITENFADGGMSSATAAIEVQDGSGISAFKRGGLVIKVNGLASKTIRWVATIDAVLTSF